ncbi:cupin domain-containing protein [Chitinophaga sp. CF418]|uniref:cupin domain-containing protein n=1 Tax=Chitinophaga sp. CF418 TaxID=1855287 RepID=UPI000913FCA8|nr:cupin domain-containing protein [Chitinophaga sp. CF418]SHN20078.1 Cupin domain-containing protein [Chitinophaga sp. CF418]
MMTEITVTQKDDGEHFGVAGGNYRVVISGAQTGGIYAVIEMTVPPGGGPPPHEHPFTREMFYVLEGELEFQTQPGKVILGKGGFIDIPLNGPIHCFRNVSGNMARLLCTVIPAGLENVFREIGIPVAPGEFLPRPELTAEREAFLGMVDQKYGQTTYAPDYFERDI